MSEDLKLYLIVSIKNTLIVIGFIILAVVFQKWWISLFSALFWTTVSGSIFEESNNKGGYK